MRAMLADASLARYAGRFVWLKLEFDKTENGAFVNRRGVSYTPTFYVIDPNDQRATATQFGTMTLLELTRFLERGEQGMLATAKTPADAALARGDELLARDQASDAANTYREALGLSGDMKPLHERALGSLMSALTASQQWQPCAEIASAEAPGMTRNEMFGRVVLEGLGCTNYGNSAPWAQSARNTLTNLAVESIALPATVRDHRFKLYQQLMGDAQDRGDKATVIRWGEKWLAEVDATKPANDDERSALDIARVDAAALMGDPSRVLPALIASEKAMSNNYNASLRVAQMEVEAKRYADGVAACNRGLAHVTGPLGRAWLMEIKADALTRAGKREEAHRVLEDALPVAQEIGPKRARENNVKNISTALKETQNAAR